MASPIIVTQVASYLGHVDAIYTLAGSGAGRFASAGAEGVVAHWHLGQYPDARGLLRGTSSIYSLAYQPERHLLAVGQSDGGLHLVDLAPTDPQPVRSASAHTAGLFDIASAGDQLWVASADGHLSRWSLDTLSCEFRLNLSSQPLRALAVSPDGSRLAVAGADRHIRVFSTTTLDPEADFVAHGHSVFSLAFSPDGQWLLSAGRDAHLRIWSPQFTLVHDVVAHTLAIHHIAFAPGGHSFATASMDKTIKLWLPPTADTPPRLLKVIDALRHDGHRASVNRLLWLAPDELISASDDRRLLHWRFAQVGN